MKLIEENHYYFLKLDKEIRNNKEKILELLEFNPKIYLLLEHKFAKDYDIIMKLSDLDLELIYFVPQEVLLDKKLSKELFKKHEEVKLIYENLGILEKVNIECFPIHIFKSIIRAL